MPLSDSGTTKPPVSWPLHGMNACAPSRQPVSQPSARMGPSNVLRNSAARRHRVAACAEPLGGSPPDRLSGAPTWSEQTDLPPTGAITGYTALSCSCLRRHVCRLSHRGLTQAGPGRRQRTPEFGGPLMAHDSTAPQALSCFTQRRHPAGKGPGGLVLHALLA